MTSMKFLRMTAFAWALFASGAGFAQNAKDRATTAATGGQPMSVPTHTVPAAPAQRLVIKTKSPPPYAPPIEEKQSAPRPAKKGSVPSTTQVPVPPAPCGPTNPNDPTTSTC